MNNLFKSNDEKFKSVNNLKNKIISLPEYTPFCFTKYYLFLKYFIFTKF